MTCVKEELSFLSSDGKSNIYAEINLPEGKPRAIIALSHGMIDHVGRYGRLVEYMTKMGFAVAGNDHLGHGRTVSDPSDFGFFAHKNGYKLVVDDLKLMNDRLHERFPELPIFLLGHSMGSFMARLYAEKYPESISGVIIHGTGGRNPLLPFGKALAWLTKVLGGDKYRAKLVTNMAFGAYNKHFDKSEGSNAWLTRDGSLVADRADDPYVQYIFSSSGYGDLFKSIGLCNSKAHFKAYPRELATLIVSGDADPVGDYGKGVRFVNKKLSEIGVRDLTFKLYEGARHELFNETNREEVFSDISEWIGKRI